MAQKFVKRGYNFSPALLDAWEKLHRPSKDFSPSAAGAFLVWMALPPDIREEARYAACQSDISKAITKIKSLLVDKLTDAEIQKFLAELSDDQKKLVFLAAKHTEEKLSRKS